MGANRRQQDSSSDMPEGQEPPAGPDAPPGAAPQAAAPPGAGMAALREDCLARLKEISARVQQLSVQASADWTRALGEAQMGAQMRQQSLFSDYLGRARQASQGPEAMKELQELSARCSRDFEASGEDARKSIEETRQQLRGTVDAGIDQANRDWDAACAEFVGALRRQLSELDPAAAEPAALAALGQSLVWIASLMRAPRTAHGR